MGKATECEWLGSQGSSGEGADTAKNEAQTSKQEDSPTAAGTTIHIDIQGSKLSLESQFYCNSKLAGTSSKAEAFSSWQGAILLTNRYALAS